MAIADVAQAADLRRAAHAARWWRASPATTSDLKDPNSENSDQPDYAKNVQRSRTPEFLVLIGICTHLGCLPKQRFEAGFPSWAPTGRAASSARATARALILPGGCSMARRPR